MVHGYPARGGRESCRAGGQTDGLESGSTPIPAWAPSARIPAIALALDSPELTVRATTCVQGNVPVGHSLANAARLLELLGGTNIPPAGLQPILVGLDVCHQVRARAHRPRAVSGLTRTARPSVPVGRAGGCEASSCPESSAPGATRGCWRARRARSAPVG